MSQSKNKLDLREIYMVCLVVTGGVLQGIGLEMFLVPNGFLDGGIVGVSIILSELLPIPMAVFLVLLNLPFVVFTWIKLGRRVAIKTVIGVATLAATVEIIHGFHPEPWTTNFSLALGYGGLFLGLGTGLALRAGGALDGTEALASFISHNSKWSVDQLILGINICVFIAAAFVLGSESAMASALLFYVVVAPLIKRVVDGGSELKLAEILTDSPQEVIEAIHAHSHRRITSSKTKAILQNGTLGEIFTVKLILSRMEEAMIGDLIMEADPEAAVLFHEVSNVRGGVYELHKTGH